MHFGTNERLEFIRGAGINDRDIECIQFKRLSDDARDVHITFSSAAVCALFSRSKNLRVKEKSYYIQPSFWRKSRIRCKEKVLLTTQLILLKRQLASGSDSVEAEILDLETALSSLFTLELEGLKI